MRHGMALRRAGISNPRSIHLIKQTRKVINSDIGVIDRQRVKAKIFLKVVGR